jgi:hypothetical protein
VSSPWRDCASVLPTKSNDGAGAWDLGMLPQHADEHSAERRVLLAVDQQLGEGATLRVAPEFSDPVGSIEVREHEDVEEHMGDGQLAISDTRNEAIRFLESLRSELRSVGTRHRRTDAPGEADLQLDGTWPGSACTTPLG